MNWPYAEQREVCSSIWGQQRRRRGRQTESSSFLNEDRIYPSTEIVDPKRMNASPYNSRAVTQAQPHEAAGSIWFEIWGVVDPDFKKSIFPGNFTNKNSIFLWQISGNYDFLQVISKKISIFQGKFLKHFDFLGNLKKFRFSKKFPKNFEFFRQFRKQEIDFSGQILEKFRFFR